MGTAGAARKWVGKPLRSGLSGYSRCFLLDSVTLQNIIQRSIRLHAQALFDGAQSRLLPRLGSESLSVFFSQSAHVSVVSLSFFPAGFVSVPFQFHMVPPFGSQGGALERVSPPAKGGASPLAF